MRRKAQCPHYGIILEVRGRTRLELRGLEYVGEYVLRVFQPSLQLKETVVDRRGRMEREGKKRGIKTNGARAADVVPRAVDPVRRRGKP